MPLKVRLGLYLLAQKTLAVIATSVAALTGSRAKAETHLLETDLGNDKVEVSKKLRIKPQLVLKLNKDGSTHTVAQHRSHSSHSSHRSHSSHSSHYSSSPSYRSGSTPTYTVPSTTYPSYTPSTPRVYTSPRITSPSSATSSYSSTTTTYASMGIFQRMLYKGCKGDDVTRLQKKLLALGYDMLVTGFFGDKTEVAVKSFQRSNELEPDGRVGEQTWDAIANK